ncbi:phage holin family protein [Gordonia sp. ABSL1-1]|uniref:phage holin family protein n=1 Tax=Gordonia sp. ABSL1-1 TaxID=3053923 RepID=UPI0025742FDB|nr:phage holin family protein [Gordonia sp. ABSL1-1]MDL9938632.1 phage holin family protein [Gordonia sp. ABSL1-1]
MRTTAAIIRGLVEFLILWVSSAFAIIALDAVLDGVRLNTVDIGLHQDSTLPAALALALVFGVLNTALWPVAMRAMSWVGPVLLFILAFALGGVIMVLALYLVPVAEVDHPATAVLMAAPLSLFGSLVGGAVAARSDTAYRLMQVRRQRFRLRHTPRPADETPGLLCIQIDGLGHGVLRRAIADGVTPTLAAMVRETHTLVEWHTDWSSQTGATQLGVLHGCNHNVPAFRWYEKETGHTAAFSNPRDNERREEERSAIEGLLANDGSSRGNLFTGGAADNVLVVSRMKGARLGGGAGYTSYFLDPASALRTVLGMIAEIMRELRQAWRQRHRDIRPRVPRGGVYPFVRAFTTVLATDMTTAAVVRDMIEGRSIIYVDLIGYDEVSHHSGISRPETLAVLSRVDETIRLLRAAAAQADRSYRLVVLSDHGQSQGATFTQRYGESLPQLVSRLCGTEVATVDERAASEGRLYAAASVNATPDPGIETETLPTSEPVVLGSGNLGLISFPDLPGRATREAIETAHPGLIDALRTHPGVGFLLVACADGTSVVLGAGGCVDVATGVVRGVDPLRDLGADALRKIRRTDTFDNVADIMVGGAYWPETDEIAAFEEQVGSHGGMGGPQSTPFLLYPHELPDPPQPVHGAESVHRILAGWRDAASPVDDAAAPVSGG